MADLVITHCMYIINNFRCSKNRTYTTCALNSNIRSAVICDKTNKQQFQAYASFSQAH